jgi:hypothetical protein
LPLTVTLVPLGALSLTSRVAVSAHQYAVFLFISLSQSSDDS